MIFIGQYNTLEILRFTPPGAYLGDDEDNVVLLPNKYLTKDMEEGQKIEVFVYLDNDQRIVSTTEQPLIELNTFAYLRCVEVTHIGAFMDWGLLKHLFVPFKEQNQKFEEGKYYLVYLYLDDATQRLVGTAKIKKRLEYEIVALEEKQEVDLLICDATDLGRNVIVNDTFSGLIYQDEIFKDLRAGDRCKGYVKKVRPDGKLDISLQFPGFEKTNDAKELILQKLAENLGKLNLSDKSDPDLIRQELNMSKKTFKQTIGVLYKSGVINIEADYIELL